MSEETGSAIPGIAWNVLVVDDEPDVHKVTAMALKRQTWRGKHFNLISAHSAAEARKVLTSSAGQDIHVALVDVVMETNHAGLDLCAFIRDNNARSLRIILRTGQPGLAPEQRVMTDFDIDFYLAKNEATPERLFSTVRACINACQEIATLLMLQDQLTRSAGIFRKAGGLEDVCAVIEDNLTFVAKKHNCRLLALGPENPGGREHAAALMPPGAQEPLLAAMREIRQADARTDTWQNVAAKVEPGWLYFVSERTFDERPEKQKPRKLLARISEVFSVQKVATDSVGTLRMVVFVKFLESSPSAKSLRDALHDVQLVLGNWHMAASIVMLQSAIADLYVMREQAKNIQNTAGFT